MNKVTTRKEALKSIEDGQAIMVGGFGPVGVPNGLLKGIMEAGLKDLTMIGNDSGDLSDPGDYRAKLVTGNRIKRLIVSHIGMNPETGRRMATGEIEVELVPQGTLAERIRCGGAGLGGALTQTGLGTLVEDGKQKLEVDGRVYLLEKPLRADVALIRAHKADRMGNLVLRRCARNYNTVMATAADRVIAEVREIVDAGELDPEEITVPGIFVDLVVSSEESVG